MQNPRFVFPRFPGFRAAPAAVPLMALAAKNACQRIVDERAAALPARLDAGG